MNENQWLRSIHSNLLSPRARDLHIAADENCTPIDHNVAVASFPGSYFCIKAFSETAFTEDLKKIDVPTLVLHGDDDQIVPFADAGPLTAKLVKNAKLVVYKGAPRGMCTTLKDKVNEDLISFIKS